MKSKDTIRGHTYNAISKIFYVRWRQDMFRIRFKGRKGLYGFFKVLFAVEILSKDLLHVGIVVVQRVLPIRYRIVVCDCLFGSIFVVLKVGGRDAAYLCSWIQRTAPGTKVDGFVQPIGSASP